MPAIAFILLFIAGATFSFYRFADEAPNYEVTMFGKSDRMTVVGLPQVGVLEDRVLATPGLSVTDVKTFPGKSRCATVMRVKSDLSDLALGDSLAFNDVKAEVRRLPFLVPPSKFVSAP